MVTGGAKSGKSRHAETQVLALGGPPVYIATAEALDAEMSDRITQHRVDRGEGWITVEEPHNLAEALHRTDGNGPRLVDCLTLWLSNRVLAEADVSKELATLCDTLQSQASPVWLVTNEVGSGIVPTSSLGRSYRDLCGVMNQRIGAVVDRVDLVVCGQALTIKGG
nr:bifunctional adenosylcobinamide kinase/adenosylcobinamide-phosphate guanylyltransferase [Marivita sp. S6314]